MVNPLLLAWHYCWSPLRGTWKALRNPPSSAPIPPPLPHPTLKEHFAKLHPKSEPPPAPPHGNACLELLLVFSEEDVEGAGKAPHGEHQEQQEPLYVSHHRAQSVNKGILGRLEHPAPAIHGMTSASRGKHEEVMRTSPQSAKVSRITLLGDLKGQYLGFRGE